MIQKLETTPTQDQDMDFQLLDENYEAKCLCVLLIDTSESMSTNGAIEEINEGLIVFRHDIIHETVLCNRLDVAIVSFNSKVDIVQYPEIIQNIKVPSLTTNGNGQIVNAIKKVQELVDERTEYYEKHGIPYFRPWIVLMTDGNFSCDQNIVETIKNINIDRGFYNYVFRVLGAGNNIQENILKEFESPDFPIEMLKNVDFRKFFIWLENKCGCIAEEFEGFDNNENEHNDKEPIDWYSGFVIPTECDCDGVSSSIPINNHVSSVDSGLIDYEDDWGVWKDPLPNNNDESSHDSTDSDNLGNVNPINPASWLDDFIIDRPTNNKNRVAYNHEPTVWNSLGLNKTTEKESFWSRLFCKKNKPQSVYSSVFAPAEVARKQHIIVQVYLHLQEDTEKVRELAIESDKNAERRGYEPLEVKLNKGDNVEIELNINSNTLLYNSRKSVTWQGSFVKRSFDYIIPSDIDVYELSCSVNVFVNGAVAGEMIFITNIVDTPRKLNTNIIAKPTKKLFISYSHKDIKSAERIAKIHEALGIDVFFDKHRLKAGYIYSEEISRFIQTADTFVLCWSKNAAESEYVEKERQEALALAYPQRQPREYASLKIHPYNIEPHAVPPVDMIEHYHFEEL